MKNLRRDVPIYIAILLTVLVAAAAKAGTVTLNWIPPTTCDDGSAIATNCPTTGFKVYGAAQGQPKVLVWTAIKTDTSAVLSNVQAGTWCYDLTTLAGTKESTLHSNEVCKTIAAPGPNPPVLTTVTTTAYTVTKARDRFVYIAIGNVPPNTRCDATQCIGLGPLYCIVPSASVSWSGTVRAPLVVAVCS